MIPLSTRHLRRSGETGRHATFRALCSKGHGGSSPPFGITRLPPSTAVFHRLHRPIEFPPPSTKIHGCLPVLLSVLLSRVMRKRQGVSVFGDPRTKKKCHF